MIDSGGGVFRVVVVAAGGVLGVLMARRLMGGGKLDANALGPGSKSGPQIDQDPGDGPAPAIVQLLKQVDASYPSRSRAADGILPSAAHHAKNPTSDHERGDALDVTFDLMNGPNLDQLASDILKDERVKYVIWNRQIANRTIDGGAWRPYVETAIQTDPHTGHMHVSVDHARRGDTSSWRIVIVPAPPAGYVSMRDKDVTQELAAWAKELLGDRTFGTGQTRTRTFGNKDVLARIEVHPPSQRIDHPHRGVSLFAPVDRVA